MKTITLALFAVILTVLVYSCDKQNVPQPVTPTNSNPTNPSSIDYRDSVVGTYTCSQYRMFYMMPDTLEDTTWQNVSLVISKDPTNAQNIIIGTSDTVQLQSNFSIIYAPYDCYYSGQFFLSQDSVSLSYNYSSMAAHARSEWNGSL